MTRMGDRPGSLPNRTERGVYQLPDLHGGGQRYVLLDAGGEIVVELAVCLPELHDGLLEALWAAHDGLKPKLRPL